MQQHRNNIGFLRLMMAYCVIVGHAPEMIYGDQSREPFHMLFGFFTLGGFAVDVFFLLSGYLITQSMMRARSAADYLERRVMRLYPAFIVSSLLSVYLLGPLVGGQVLGEWGSTAQRIILLRQPMEYPGQFPGMSHPINLNGATWTIAYEFRCYLAVIGLASFGMFARRGIMLVVTAVSLVGLIAVTYSPVNEYLTPVSEFVQFLFGNVPQTLRLTSVFLVGMSLYLYREEFLRRLTGKVAFASLAGAIVLIYDNPHFGEALLVTLGAVPLFWLAFKANIGKLQTINDRWDISYGVYLYGWPIANYLRWQFEITDPWLLAAVTMLLATAAGAASWMLIEAPLKGYSMLALARRNITEKAMVHA